MDGGAQWAIVHGVAKSWSRLSDFTHSHTMEYYSAIKKNVFVSVLTRWKNLGPIIQSEERKSQILYINSRIFISKEKAMAPHSSTLAWDIPWMEEPGRLQSMGLRRVRHD